jgi:replication factor C subunit 1
MMDSFGAAAILLNKVKRKAYTIRGLMDLFFIDYDMIPLLIFESYLDMRSTDEHTLDMMAEASESIAFGDMVNQKVRANGEWGLLSTMGQASVVHPVSIIDTNVSYVKFPEWFGKNSTQSKLKRMIREVRGTLAMTISGNDETVISDYVPALYRLIMKPLQNGEVA